VAVIHELERVGAYRFDDPVGEVGIETHLVRAGERLLHVPLTYRANPMITAGSRTRRRRIVRGPFRNTRSGTRQFAE
jgi:hypothetical protein